MMKMDWAKLNPSWETAEAGSTVTVKQQKDGSDFSIAATTKVLGRLEDVSGYSPTRWFGCNYCTAGSY